MAGIERQPSLLLKLVEADVQLDEDKLLDEDELLEVDDDDDDEDDEDDADTVAVEEEQLSSRISCLKATTLPNVASMPFFL